MRIVTIGQPGVEGMVTDLPGYAVPLRASVFTQDGVTHPGLLTQRRGWAFDGTTADVASDLYGIGRAKFVLTAQTRTVTADTSGRLWQHNAASAGSQIFPQSDAPVFGSPGLLFLPRCVYRDELIFCETTGQYPLLRYSGGVATPFTGGLAGITASSATVTISVDPGSPTIGQYVSLESIAALLGPKHPPTDLRIREVVTDQQFTIDDVRFAGGATNIPYVGRAYARTYPCVSVYNSGVVSVAGTATITGVGTKWLSGSWGNVRTHVGAGHNGFTGDDAILLKGNNVTAWELGLVLSVASDTSIGTSGITNIAAPNEGAYSIMRRCPFKDAASHKGSLWGTGVAQYPNRVYVWPPGANLSFAPGAAAPYDPTASMQGSNTDPFYFTLESIDVPVPWDSDPNVAILSSPNPLLVLKRDSVYGIFGSWPTTDTTTSLLASGAGCLDLRSAISTEEGQFWAGENGIYHYRNGEIVDLTAGRLNREWRALTAGFGVGAYISAGVGFGHLLVTFLSAGVSRTYVYDLRSRTWVSRFNNVNGRGYASARISGENEKLLFVHDTNQGRVMDLMPALNLSGTARDGDSNAPQLKLWTGQAIAQANGIEGETRMADLEVHANVQDSAAAGTTQVAVSTVRSGGLLKGGTAGQETTKTLDPILSDTVDLVDRHKRVVNSSARLHQVRFEVSTTSNTVQKVELAELVATLRDLRRMT